MTRRRSPGMKSPGSGRLPDLLADRLMVDVLRLTLDGHSPEEANRLAELKVIDEVRSTVRARKKSDSVMARDIHPGSSSSDDPLRAMLDRLNIPKWQIEYCRSFEAEHGYPPKEIPLRRPKVERYFCKSLLDPDPLPDNVIPINPYRERAWRHPRTGLIWMLNDTSKG